MRITIISVGKKHEPAINDLVETYQKRLKDFTFEWRLVAPEHRTNSNEQRATESNQITALLPDDSYVVLLDETGKLLDNRQLAGELAKTRDTGQHVVFIIGGAYGVDANIKQRANLVWSLSPLVFPHQLVRAILIEQIYRSAMILQGHPYHHQ
jgi:23S rRNA (pseudouridine1915-N3)-methyltransferase